MPLEYSEAFELKRSPGPTQSSFTVTSETPAVRFIQIHRTKLIKRKIMQITGATLSFLVVTFKQVKEESDASNLITYFI